MCAADRYCLPGLSHSSARAAQLALQSLIAQLGLASSTSQLHSSCMVCCKAPGNASWLVITVLTATWGLRGHLQISMF